MKMFPFRKRFRPAVAMTSSWAVATAVGGAIARLVWIGDGPPAPEGSPHEEERFVAADVAADLKRWLREQGIRR